MLLKPLVNILCASFFLVDRRMRFVHTNNLGISYLRHIPAKFARTWVRPDMIH